MNGRPGMTLLELLAVVVIIGILAAVGAPQFFRSIERSRSAEALHILGAIRNAQLQYRSVSGGGTQYTTVGSQLDVDIPSGGTTHWTYTLAGSTPVSDNPNATATRNTTNGGTVTNTIVIDLNSGAICAGDAASGTAYGLPTTGC